MYNWRRMSPEQRDEVLAARQLAKQPWHGPPHACETGWFHLSAACFEHQPVIGASLDRMLAFEAELLRATRAKCLQVMAWCVLPNHYHLLAQCLSLPECRRALGDLHSGTSRLWTQEDALVGRQCWYRCLPKRVKNDAHRWATLNYIHHNPVRHGYVAKWQEWPLSSAAAYLEAVGRAQAERVWREYPVLDMGDGWDD